MGKNKHYSPLEFDATVNMMRPSKVSADKRFIFVKICGENDRFGKWAVMKYVKMLYDFRGFFYFYNTS